MEEVALRRTVTQMENAAAFSDLEAALQVKFCMLMLATEIMRCKLDNRFNISS